MFSSRPKSKTNRRNCLFINQAVTAVWFDCVQSRSAVTSREGHGAMVNRAWRFGDVAACRAVSSTAWFFRDHASPISILGHCFNVVSLGIALKGFT